MGDLIPIFGMITGALMTAAVVIGLVKIAHGPVGQALGRRIQGKAGEDEELRHEVAWMREQLEEVQGQLAETQERLDFAERLLARSPQPERLRESN